MTGYNVICIKWGDFYSSEEVNKLYRGVKNNTSFPVNFYCFTDNPDNLDKDVIVYPLPEIGVPGENKMEKYRKTVGLSDNNLADLKGKRVFLFDIDSLIVDNLDELFTYPQKDEFYIINDWRHRKGKKSGKVGQASCYSFVVGTIGYVKDYFKEHYPEILQKYGTASQQYLSAKIIEHRGKLNFWPDNWFKSFRFHCIPNVFLRWFIAPRLPEILGLKMIAFHGEPGIYEALNGVWCYDKTSAKYPHGYKKIYKHIRKTLWIKEYWK